MNARSPFSTAVLSSLITLVLVFSLFASAAPTSARSGGPMENQNAVEAESAYASAAGPQYLHIAGSGFVPMYGATNQTYGVAGCFYSDGTLDAQAFFNFSLVIPNGSVIEEIRLYYRDDSAYNMTLRMWEMDDGNGSFLIAGVSSSGDMGGANFNTITLSEQVDFVNFSYVLEVQMNDTGSEMQLCGARVKYTPPGIFGLALPLVEKQP